MKIKMIIPSSGVQQILLLKILLRKKSQQKRNNRKFEKTIHPYKITFNKTAIFKVTHFVFNSGFLIGVLR